MDGRTVNSCKGGMVLLVLCLVIIPVKAGIVQDVCNTTVYTAGNTTGLQTTLYTGVPSTGSCRSVATGAPTTSTSAPSSNASSSNVTHPFDSCVQRYATGLCSRMKGLVIVGTNGSLTAAPSPSPAPVTPSTTTRAPATTTAAPSLGLSCSSFLTTCLQPMMACLLDAAFLVTDCPWAVDVRLAVLAARAGSIFAGGALQQSCNRLVCAQYDEPAGLISRTVAGTCSNTSQWLASTVCSSFPTYGPTAAPTIAPTTRVPTTPSPAFLTDVWMVQVIVSNLTGDGSLGLPMSASERLWFASGVALTLGIDTSSFVVYSMTSLGRARRQTDEDDGPTEGWGANSFKDRETLHGRGFQRQQITTSQGLVALISLYFPQVAMNASGFITKTSRTLAERLATLLNNGAAATPLGQWLVIRSAQVVFIPQLASPPAPGAFPYTPGPLYLGPGTGTNAPSGKTWAGGTGSISPGAVAGLLIGLLIAIFIAAAVGFVYLRRRDERKKEKKRLQEEKRQQLEAARAEMMAQQAASNSTQIEAVAGEQEMRQFASLQSADGSGAVDSNEYATGAASSTLPTPYGAGPRYAQPFERQPSSSTASGFPGAGPAYGNGPPSVYGSGSLPPSPSTLRHPNPAYAHPYPPQPLPGQGPLPLSPQRAGRMLATPPNQSLPLPASGLGLRAPSVPSSPQTSGLAAQPTTGSQLQPNGAPLAAAATADRPASVWERRQAEGNPLPRILVSDASSLNAPQGPVDGNPSPSVGPVTVAQGWPQGGRGRGDGRPMQPMPYPLPGGGPPPDFGRGRGAPLPWRGERGRGMEPSRGFPPRGRGGPAPYFDPRFGWVMPGPGGPNPQFSGQPSPYRGGPGPGQGPGPARGGFQPPAGNPTQLPVPSTPNATAQNSDHEQDLAVVGRRETLKPSEFEGHPPSPQHPTNTAPRLHVEPAPIPLSPPRAKSVVSQRFQNARDGRETQPSSPRRADSSNAPFGSPPTATAAKPTEEPLSLSDYSF
jgi:hypothetical protein